MKLSCCLNIRHKRMNRNENRLACRLARMNHQGSRIQPTVFIIIDESRYGTLIMGNEVRKLEETA